MGGELKVGDRVRVTAAGPLYGCHTGEEGTVVLITRPDDRPPLYHVRIDRPRPEDLVSLYWNEIKPVA